MRQEQSVRGLNILPCLVGSGGPVVRQCLSCLACVGLANGERGAPLSQRGEIFAVKLNTRFNGLQKRLDLINTAQ